MKLRYVGGRGYIAQDFCHVRYVFSKKNDYVCEKDIPLDIARRLLRLGDYVPVEAEEIFEEVEREVLTEDGQAKPAVKRRKRRAKKIKQKEEE